MEHILKEAGATASLGWMMGVTTALFVVAFVGWTLWAWAPSRRGAMERAAMMPLDEE